LKIDKRYSAVNKLEFPLAFHNDFSIKKNKRGGKEQPLFEGLVM